MTDNRRRQFWRCYQQISKSFFIRHIWAAVHTIMAVRVSYIVMATCISQVHLMVMAL